MEMSYLYASDLPFKSSIYSRYSQKALHSDAKFQHIVPQLLKCNFTLE